MINKIKNDLSYWIVLFFLISINVVFSRIPLFNTIGFEISAINSILLSFIFGNFLLRKRFLEKNLLPLLKQLKIKLLLLLLIPFLISIVSTKFAAVCPFSVEIWFYPLIILPGLIFTLGLLAICKRSKRLKKTKFNLLILFVLLLPSLELFYFPQVYFYSIFIGYFPGTFYDETITISNMFLFHRLIVLTLGLVILFIFSSKRVKVSYKILNWYFGICFCILFIFKGVFGFASPLSFTKKALNNKITTEHFNIYCDSKLTNNDKTLIALEHEYYFTSLSEKLEIDFDETITSFVFSNSEQKRKFFGAENADVAKPWLNHIYINYENYQNTLKHEIAHVLSGEFGKTIFKIADNINPTMIEGMATALEDDFLHYNPHYFAYLLLKSGYRINLEKLFTGMNFFSTYSSISYIISGSFLKYLISKYGVGKIKQLYGNTDFNQIYGENLNQLQNAYTEFILNSGFEFNENSTLLYFGRRPIFRKICVRYAANKMREAQKSYQDSSYKNAKSIFKDMYKYTGNYSSLHGRIKSMLKLGENEKAFQLLEKEIIKFDSTSYIFRLRLLEVEILFANKKIEMAKEKLKESVIQSPTFNYLQAANIQLKILDYNSMMYPEFRLLPASDKKIILKKLFLKSSDPTILYELIRYSKENELDEAGKLVKSLSKNYETTSFKNSVILLSERFFENLEYEKALKILQTIKSEYLSKNEKWKVNKIEQKFIWFIKFANSKLKRITFNEF